MSSILEEEYEEGQDEKIDKIIDDAHQSLFSTPKNTINNSVIVKPSPESAQSICQTDRMLAKAENKVKEVKRDVGQEELKGSVLQFETAGEEAEMTEIRKKLKNLLEGYIQVHKSCIKHLLFFSQNRTEAPWLDTEWEKFTKLEFEIQNKHSQAVKLSKKIESLIIEITRETRLSEQYLENKIYIEKEIEDLNSYSEQIQERFSLIQTEVNDLLNKQIGSPKFTQKSQPLPKVTIKVEQEVPFIETHYKIIRQELEQSHNKMQKALLQQREDLKKELNDIINAENENADKLSTLLHEKTEAKRKYNFELLEQIKKSLSDQHAALHKEIKDLQNINSELINRINEKAKKITEQKEIDNHENSVKIIHSELEKLIIIKKEELKSLQDNTMIISQKIETIDLENKQFHSEIKELKESFPILPVLDHTENKTLDKEIVQLQKQFLDLEKEEDSVILQKKMSRRSSEIITKQQPAKKQIYSVFNNYDEIFEEKKNELNTFLKEEASEKARYQELLSTLSQQSALQDLTQQQATTNNIIKSEIEERIQKIEQKRKNLKNKFNSIPLPIQKKFPYPLLISFVVVFVGILFFLLTH